MTPKKAAVPATPVELSLSNEELCNIIAKREKEQEALKQQELLAAATREKQARARKLTNAKKAFTVAEKAFGDAQTALEPYQKTFVQATADLEKAQSVLKDVERDFEILSVTPAAAASTPSNGTGPKSKQESAQPVVVVPVSPIRKAIRKAGQDFLDGLLFRK